MCVGNYLKVCYNSVKINNLMSSSLNNGNQYIYQNLLKYLLTLEIILLFWWIMPCHVGQISFYMSLYNIYKAFTNNNLQILSQFWINLVQISNKSQKYTNIFIQKDTSNCHFCLLTLYNGAVFQKIRVQK